MTAEFPDHVAHVSLGYARTNAVTASGADFSCSLLRDCILDLHRYQYIDDDEYRAQMEALDNLVLLGALPGSTRFWSVYSYERVFWPQLVEEMRWLYAIAVNNNDQTQSDEENQDPNVSIDLYDDEDFPVNIGQWAMRDLN